MESKLLNQHFVSFQTGFVVFWEFKDLLKWQFTFKKLLNCYFHLPPLPHVWCSSFISVVYEIYEIWRPIKSRNIFSEPLYQLWFHNFIIWIFHFITGYLKIFRNNTATRISSLFLTIAKRYLEWYNLWGRSSCQGSYSVCHHLSTNEFT